MRRKIVPGNCRRCITRRKEAEAKKWEAALGPLVRIPVPAVTPKKPFVLFRIFKQIGGSR
jgi:hypothetical protein